MSGQQACSYRQIKQSGKRLFALVSLIIGLSMLTSCSLVQSWWQRAGQAAQGVQEGVQKSVQEKGNELQSAINQKIEDAAAEAQKRFNEQKDKLIDDYLNQLKSNLKGSTNLNLPAGQQPGAETK